MKNNNLVEKNDRNYGIDLLRIVSMIYVLFLHCIGQGGLLSNTIVNSSQYKLVWFIEICSYVSVNVFALISGYVIYKEEERKFKISNYINLWLQIVFYGFVITILFNIFASSVQINLEAYIKVLFPVTNKLYWYFTAYTGLFFIMPFLIKRN